MNAFKISLCIPAVFLAAARIASAPLPVTQFQPDGLINQEASLPAKEHLLYHNPLSSDADIAEWVMEGPGQTEFDSEWMHLRSPGEKMDHVLWCPERFPASFIAEWEVQNLNPDAGLCIVFFCAAATNSTTLFDPSLAERSGIFKQYIRGDFSNYHISFYANSPDNPDRGCANLRKNPGFNYVQRGDEGIPVNSTEIHRLTLAKSGGRITFWVDERKVIDWTDDGQIGGDPYGAGQIGFRQMSWTRFRYRNFRVWSLDGEKVSP